MRARGFTFYHYMIDLTGGPCIYKRISGCGSGTEYMAVTPWGDLYPCHQFVGDEKYRMGDIWNGCHQHGSAGRVQRTATPTPARSARTAGQSCTAPAAVRPTPTTPPAASPGVYEYGCELFRKRMECAIMIQVAQNQELAAQGIEVPIQLGSTCNACADGEACE